MSDGPVSHRQARVGKGEPAQPALVTAHPTRASQGVRAAYRDKK